ncbi:MAG: RNA methyltransferase, partial [Actinobacteria bacterium]|nr:RNA methyltransferase [Actinomycetota bacterium]
MITTISSSQDPRLDPLRLNERQLTTIAERRSTLAAGRFIAEGDLVVARALDSGYKPEVVLCDAEQATRFCDSIARLGGQCLSADIEIRRQATGLGVPLSALGVFFRPEPKKVDEIISNSKRIIVVEAVDNPSNIGAIVRCATGLGWDGLICDSTSADPLSRRALRVSMGSAFNLPFARTSDILQTLEMLRAQNFATYALTPSTSSLDLTQVKLKPTQKRALIFGSERAGLSETVLAKADTCVKIEMNPDVDSLNVAAAAAIACYSLR